MCLNECCITLEGSASSTRKLGGQMADAIKKLSLEDQLSTLALCGIRLKPGIGIETLLKTFDKDVYENEPYVPLLACMGAGATEHGKVISNVWHFDSECIENHGDYAAIAERLRDISNGAYPLENIEDFVDIENNKAWVSFTLNGKHYKWKARVNEDWVDPNILAKFAHLLRSTDSGKQFSYLDLGGQDCIISCCTQTQLDNLKKKTGLPFTWLTDAGTTNLYVWLLALAPVLGTLLEKALGRAIGINPNYLFFITIVLNVGLAFYDAKIIAKSGFDISLMGSTWLVPVYLKKRAEVLGESKAYFYVWCLMFIIMFFL